MEWQNIKFKNTFIGEDINDMILSANKEMKKGIGERVGTLEDRGYTIRNGNGND